MAAGLDQKIEAALNDVRILVLGGQVIIGAAYRSVFNEGFAQLPQATQYCKTAALAGMLLGLGLLMVPASYHRLALNGENTPALLKLATRILQLALFPFAAGLAIDAFVGVELLLSTFAGVAVASALLIVALAFWYVLPTLRRRPSAESEEEMKKQGPTSIDDKVKEVLTEARMVLPGVQALLGFGIAVMFAQGFEKLPPAAKWTHLGSLLTISLSSILLIAIAAQHRIGERGENTEQFHGLAGKFIIAALFFLGVGLAGEFFVVLQKIQFGIGASILCATAIFIAFVTLWYGYPLSRRGRLT